MMSFVHFCGDLKERGAFDLSKKGVASHFLQVVPWGERFAVRQVSYPVFSQSSLHEKIVWRGEVKKEAEERAEQMAKQRDISYVPSGSMPICLYGNFCYGKLSEKVSFYGSMMLTEENSEGVFCRAFMRDPLFVISTAHEEMEKMEKSGNGKFFFVHLSSDAINTLLLPDRNYDYQENLFDCSWNHAVYYVIVQGKNVIKVRYPSLWLDDCREGFEGVFSLSEEEKQRKERAISCAKKEISYTYVSEGRRVISVCGGYGDYGVYQLNGMSDPPFPTLLKIAGNPYASKETALQKALEYVAREKDTQFIFPKQIPKT